MKRALDSSSECTNGDSLSSKKANVNNMNSQNHSTEPAAPAAVPSSSSSSGDHHHLQQQQQGDDPVHDFLQKNRTQALQLELLNKKRMIHEARRELELMRKKSREMEALVSLIQRAWSQLDIDASLLLDSLGDPEAVISERGANDMLYRFLHVSGKYYQLDPTHDQVVPSLDSFDEWVSPEEIEQARQQTETTIKQESSVADAEINEEQKLEEHLAGHVSFTMTLLERLCNAINDSNIVSAIPQQTQQNIIQIKENYSRIMFLNDEILKLRLEMVALHAKLAKSENVNVRLNKRLDKATLTIQSLEETKSHLQSLVASGQIAGGEGTTGTENTQSTSNSEAIKHYEHKIKVLERQLGESEAAKADAEMRYTERISRPVAHSEVQVQDMRKAMEDLRAQCKQRVLSLIAENEGLQDKVRDLTLAVEQVEKGSAAKIAEFVQATEAELVKLRSEKASLEEKLVMHRQDRSILEQLKKNLNEYQALEEAKKQEIEVLNQQVKNITATNEHLKEHLKSSRRREERLEKIILQHNIPLPQGLKIGKHTSSASSSAASTPSGAADASLICGATNLSNNEEGELTQSATETVHPNSTILSHYQKQYAELATELSDARNTINDLITEIDSLSTQTQAMQNQNDSLLRQVVETQGLQTAILEENISLQNQIESGRKEQQDIIARMESLKKLMNDQEALLAQVRAEEGTLSSSLHASQRACIAASSGKHTAEQEAGAFEQKINQLEHQIQALAKRDEEVTKRCRELTQEVSAQRKSRQEAEKELSALLPLKQHHAKQKALHPEGNQVLMNQDDVDMLDMALNMLKCSVCKERFKSVAITRCYHLFCRDCIEENIRNRSRKCPACGEKFGQDDVANVYFTH
eukprot:gene4991-5481_t